MRARPWNACPRNSNGASGLRAFCAYTSRSSTSTSAAFPIAVCMAINLVTRRAPLQGAEPEVLQNNAAAEDTPLDEVVCNEAKAELQRGLERLKAWFK